MKEIIEHAWFKDIDVQKLMKKEIDLPEEFKPELSDDPLDLAYFMMDDFTDQSMRETVINENAKELIRNNAHRFNEFDV